MGLYIQYTMTYPSNFFLQSNRNRVDLLSHDSKPTVKREQYKWRAGKKLDGYSEVATAAIKLEKKRKFFIHQLFKAIYSRSLNEQTCIRKCISRLQYDSICLLGAGIVCMRHQQQRHMFIAVRINNCASYILAFTVPGLLIKLFPISLNIMFPGL